MDNKIETPTPEELKAEEEALKESKEEEVRAAVVAEFGFDEEADAEKIDKLVKKEMDHRAKLSGAIGQKIKYRNAAGTKEPEKKPQSKTSIDADEVDKKVAGGVAAALEQRDLDDMPHNDEIKAAIKRVAQIQNITVKKAEKDPYVVSLIEEDKKAQEVEEAAISNKNNKGGGGSKKNWSPTDPPNVDMSTPEGRKVYQEWKDWARTQA